MNGDRREEITAYSGCSGDCCALKEGKSSTDTGAVNFNTWDYFESRGSLCDHIFFSCYVYDTATVRIILHFISVSVIYFRHLLDLAVFVDIDTNCVMGE